MSTATYEQKKLASALAHAVADWDEQTTPKATQIAKAKADGIAIGAHAMGYGMTPNAVFLDVMDWVRANPRPAAGGAYPAERKAWQAKVDAEVADIIAKLHY
ncbi:hypothetical protein PBI_HILLTOPFARM_114 [Mycobacterium phage Hilltopfarm]|nr:hypothetical protein PBI_HILLTOPFARM_114 [Mycobacterium phage Hilltopfarm]